MLCVDTTLLLLGRDCIIVIITWNREALIVGNINGLVLLILFVFLILYFDVVFELIIDEAIRCHDTIHLLHSRHPIAVSFVKHAVSILIITYRPPLHLLWRLGDSSGYGFEVLTEYS